MRSVVFVDLDSTLANTKQRQHIIDDARAAGREPDWDEYSLACYADEPFPGPIQLLRMLSWEGYYIVIVSGRSKVAMAQTNDWLYRHGVPFNELLLKDKAQADLGNSEYKVRAIKTWLMAHPDHEDLLKPTLIIEDWPEAKDAMEAEGWKVLLVNPDYDRSNLKV